MRSPYHCLHHPIHDPVLPDSHPAGIAAGGVDCLGAAKQRFGSHRMKPRRVKGAYASRVTGSLLRPDRLPVGTRYRAALASARPRPWWRYSSSTSIAASHRPASPRPSTTTPPSVAQTRTSSRHRRARATRAWSASTSSVSLSGGAPTRGLATVRRSIVSMDRPVRSSSAPRKRGCIVAARLSQSSVARKARTQRGSSSVNTTEWAVNAITPASRWLGCGTTVIPPSGGG